MDSPASGKNVLFNNNQLIRLITNLHTLTGIWANIFDAHGRDIQIRSAHSDFCQAIKLAPGGSERCVQCDAEAVKRCRSTGSSSLYSYRCHAGLCEFLLPIYEKGEPIAYLVFGQLLDDSSVLKQWEQTLPLLSWYGDDPQQLRESFFRLKQCSQQEINAFAEVVEALASYIQLEGIIRSTEHSDAQHLEAYLDTHYMEPLSLSRISNDLKMGTTKLCTLAKATSGGLTITQMIAQRRINAAKILLSSSSQPVSVIAETVGFSDYNYFTRIFKSLVGLSPRDFRKSEKKSSRKD